MTSRPEIIANAPRELGDHRPQGGGRRASVTLYRKVLHPGHPLAQSDGKVYVHRLVLFEKIGDGKHLCHWCARPVHWFASPRLVVDHLDDDGWNNAPENLVPACNYCNSERSVRVDFLTHCAGGHLWGDGSTGLRGNGGRYCKLCSREREKKRRLNGSNPRHRGGVNGCGS